jgi:hypothetical protein
MHWGAAPSGVTSHCVLVVAGADRDQGRGSSGTSERVVAVAEPVTATRLARARFMGSATRPDPVVAASSQSRGNPLRVKSIGGVLVGDRERYRLTIERETRFKLATSNLAT